VTPWARQTREEKFIEIAWFVWLALVWFGWLIVLLLLWLFT